MKTFNDLISTTARRAMQDDRRIRRLISRIVPADALAHIQFCRFDSRVLRITVDNAAWLSRLRFSERQLIDALRCDDIDADTISWHVAVEKPVNTCRESTRSVSTGATTRSAAIVRTTANAMEEGDLKQALLTTVKNLEAGME